MQIRLTVQLPQRGPAHGSDVLVTAPAGTPLGAVTSGLADAVAGAGAGGSSGGAAVPVFSGTRRLDPDRALLGEPPLVDGAILALGGPAEPEAGDPADVDTDPGAGAAARLQVTAGPDAGGVHLLHGGRIRIGRSADAEVPLDDPDVSRLHCALDVAESGAMSVCDLGSTNGTRLDGAVVGETPVPLRAGAVLRIGESELRVALPAGGFGAGAEGAAPVAGGLAAGAVPGAATGPVPGLAPEGAMGIAAAGGLPGQRGGAGSATSGSGGAGGPAAWSGADGGATGAPQAQADAVWPGGAAGADADGVRRTGPAADPETIAGPRPGGAFDGPAGTTSHGTAAAGAGGLGSVRPGAGGPAGATSHGIAAEAGGIAAAGPGEDGPGLGGRPSEGGPSGPQTSRAGSGAAQVPEAGSGGRLSAGSAAAEGRAVVPPPRPGATPSRGTNLAGDAAVPAARMPADAAGHTAPPVPPGPVSPTRGIRSWARRLAGGRGEAAAAQAAPQPGAAVRPALATPPTTAALAAARWPDPAALLLTALEPGPRLWERSADHPDALHVRLGTAEPAAVAAGAYGASPAEGAAQGHGPHGLAPHDHATHGLVTPDRAAYGQATHDAAHHLAAPAHPAAAPTGAPLAGAAAVDRALAADGALAVSLREVGALGLAGPRPRLAGLARSVLGQLAALHSPEVLELVLVSTDRYRPLRDRLADWSWLGWLPHLRPARGQDCRLLTAYDRDQATARLAELTRRLDETGAARPAGPPYTVLIVDGDPAGADLRAATARLAARGAGAGIHVISLAETPAATAATPLTKVYEAACAASAPFAECGAVAMLSGDVATGLRVLRRPGSGARPIVPGDTAQGTGQAWLFGPGAERGGVPGGGWLARAVSEGASGAQTAGALVAGTVDAVSAAWAERLARALAPLADPAANAPGTRHPGELPETVRLLDELGLARATPTALAARWTERTQALAVFGAGPRGPLEADLTREGVHHVYVEGPAGSGKTELLRSLAASLAASERTDRLHLILVDGGGTDRGEGLRVCTDLPHVETYLPAADPVRMREFAQELVGELKRRAELSAEATAAAAEGSGADGAGPGGPGGSVPGPRTGDVEAAPSGTLRLRTRDSGQAIESPATDGRAARRAVAALPAVVVVVDDYDALVAPALGSTARPAAGSVVRALDAVAREGARLGMYVVAASGRPDRTASTTAAELAGLRVTLGAPDPADAPPGRGVLVARAGGPAVPFQAGRVTGRIPRTTTARPTVVPLEWERMGVPPTSRPLRELGNGPTDLALLASALQRV